MPRSTTTANHISKQETHTAPKEWKNSNSCTDSPNPTTRLAQNLRLQKSSSRASKADYTISGKAKKATPWRKHLRLGPLTLNCLTLSVSAKCRMGNRELSLEERQVDLSLTSTFDFQLFLCSLFIAFISILNSPTIVYSKSIFIGEGGL